jgi:hypothetical protein
MFAKKLDQIGDLNPQLFRELKGNFKPRNVILSLTIAVILQIMLIVTFSNDNCINYDQVAHVCGEREIEIEWAYLWNFLNYIIPMVAYLGGVYQLISDLSKEQNRGTLNFIKLTPQSSYKILSGKILGVPSLIYLAILSCIPLHFISGIFANISVFWILGMYSLWIVGGLFFSVIATFYTLLVGIQINSNSINTSINGLGCVVVFMLGMPYVQMVNFAYELYSKGDFVIGQWTWFLLPLGKVPFMAYLWLLISVLTLTYWLWEGVNRRFNNPNKTSLSKIQGYGLITSFQLWLLGFVIPSYEGGITTDHFGVGLLFMFLLIPTTYLILMFAITPHRQNVLDWVRYRHKMNNSRNLWQDLLIGEKSPAIFAICVSGFVSIIMWGSWVLFVPKSTGFYMPDFTIPEMIVALILTLTIFLIYGVVVQFSLFMKNNQRVAITGVNLVIVIVSPLVLGTIASIKLIDIPLIWAFSPMPSLVFMTGGMITAFMGFFGQIALLSLLTLNLTKKIKKAGVSETKALLSNS